MRHLGSTLLTRSPPVPAPKSAVWGPFSGARNFGPWLRRFGVRAVFLRGQLGPRFVLKQKSRKAMLVQALSLTQAKSQVLIFMGL